MLTIQELKSKNPGQLGHILRKLIAEKFGHFAKGNALTIRVSPYGNVVIVTTSNPTPPQIGVNSAPPSEDAN